MTTADFKTGPAAAAWLPRWSELAAARAAKAGEPAWALEQRRQAATLAESMPFPDRRLELWRRTDFGSLALEGLEPFAAGVRARTLDDLPAPLLERLASESQGGMALVVQRGAEVVLEQTHPALARRGVIVCSMERALREHADKLETRLGSLIETDLDQFTALQRAMRSGGAFVWVPDGVEAEVPIRLFQWLDRPGIASAPASVVVLGQGSRATVIEEMLSETAEGAAFFNGSTEVFVGEDAKLIYATLQDWGRNVFHYSNQRARVGRGVRWQTATPRHRPHLCFLRTGKSAVAAQQRPG